MDCPVCWGCDNEPKRLNCSHTLCLECAHTLLRATINQGQEPHVTCPLCQTSTSIPDGMATSLPTNLLGKKLQDIMVEYGQPANEHDLCQLCENTVNISDMKFCHDCSFEMCIKCAVKHRTDSRFESHKVETKGTLYCKFPHTQRQECKYFCTQCDKFLCLVCTSHNRCGDHADYTKPIKDLKTEKLTEIAESKKRMKNEVKMAEADLEPVLSKIRKKQHQFCDVKFAIQNHVQKQIDLIKCKEKTFLEEIGMWERKCGDLESCVLSKQANEKVVEELLRSADEGIKEGIEQIIITASLLKSSLPPTLNAPPSSDVLETEINFEPEDSLNVGKLMIIPPSSSTAHSEVVEDIAVVTGAVNEGLGEKSKEDLNSERKYVDIRGDVVSLWDPPPRLEWEKNGLQYGACVTWTPTGRIIVCEHYMETNNIVMCSGEGEVIGNRKEVHRLNDYPCQVTCDPQEPVIIVSNLRASLTFLSAVDLSVVREVKLEGGGQVCGVCVLSDGTLVVSTDNPPTLSLHGRQGKRLRKITHYTDHRGQHHPVCSSSHLTVLPDDPLVVSTDNPSSITRNTDSRGQHHPVCSSSHLTVLPDDTLVVSMTENHHVVYLSPDGGCLHVVDVRYPQGLTHTPRGDVILIAGDDMPNTVYHLCNVAGEIQKKVVLELPITLSPSGNISLRDDQLAILYYDAIHLYKCAAL